jgi:hypothetical protein
MLGTLIDYFFKFIVGFIGFASFPTLELKRTSFGWLDVEKRRLVLLVWLKFRNNSQKPFLLNSIEVDFVGERLKPAEAAPVHFSCLTESGWLTESLNRVDNIMASPQIPPCDVVERFALFHIPVATALGQDGVFDFTIRANFPLKRTRQESFVLRDKL